MALGDARRHKTDIVLGKPVDTTKWRTLHKVQNGYLVRSLIAACRSENDMLGPLLNACPVTISNMHGWQPLDNNWGAGHCRVEAHRLSSSAIGSLLETMFARPLRSL